MASGNIGVDGRFVTLVVVTTPLRRQVTDGDTGAATLSLALLLRE